jgi:integrase
VQVKIIEMKVKLFLDRRSSSNEGRHPIKLYVNNVSKFLISTGYFAADNEWNEGWYIGMYKPRNVVLSKMIAQVENYFLTCGKMSDKELRTNIEKLLFPEEDNNKEKNFVYYFKEFMDTKKNRTKEIYQITLDKIGKFDPDCMLDSIDRKWLIDFDNWMSNKLAINTRAIHLRNIRAVFNFCIDEEITTNYPFRRFSIKKEETPKRAITVEQLRQLRDYPIEYKGYEKFRDFFMLMFYLIGINIIDFYNLTDDNIRDGRIIYHRAKTNKLYSIKIEPEAQKIIDKYKGKGRLIETGYNNYHDFVHNMDNKLKKIGPYKREGMGGKKTFNGILPNISTYTSRHTWATLAYEIGTSKDIISQALGHNIGSPVTSVYIKTDQIKVDEANRKVIDYVNQE